MPPRAALVVGLATAALLAACSGTPTPGESETASATASPAARRPPVPHRVFAPSSFWYSRLPASTPTDPRSSAIVRDLRAAAVEHGRPGLPNVTLNTHDYTPPLVTTTPSDPVHDVRAAPGCRLHPRVAESLRGLRIPDDLRPAGGSDHEAALHDPATDRYTDLWRLTRGADGSWTACGGGSIQAASRSDGVFPFPIGTTATGLPFAGGIIRADELRRGRIDHVVGVAVPYAAAAPAHSWPAVRSDGRNPRGQVVLRQGQRLRLPADLDVDSLGLTPTARTIARAAQEYGLIVWDTSGAVSFRAENASAFSGDPYPGLLRVGSGWEALNGSGDGRHQPFPLDRLEVLPVDYGR
ncbi:MULTISPECIES: hypothetical protein [Arsenicicoccus]|uniref:hypothetical protein n=1 Tax=Arsenicicoccus TaxID=267408 RepID=UPI00257B11AF|nr:MULTISPECIES: hypothetical protein [Arsenicicoccus]